MVVVSALASFWSTQAAYKSVRNKVYEPVFDAADGHGRRLGIFQSRILVMKLLIAFNATYTSSQCHFHHDTIERNPHCGTSLELCLPQEHLERDGRAHLRVKCDLRTRRKIHSVREIKKKYTRAGWSLTCKEVWLDAGLVTGLAHKVVNVLNLGHCLGVFRKFADFSVCLVNFPCLFDFDRDCQVNHKISDEMSGITFSDGVSEIEEWERFCFKMMVKFCFSHIWNSRISELSEENLEKLEIVFFWQSSETTEIEQSCGFGAVFIRKNSKKSDNWGSGRKKMIEGKSPVQPRMASSEVAKSEKYLIC